VTFLEGYLFDRPEAKAAFVRASEIAQAADRRVALTLSDMFCVERHRDSFRHLVKNHIDVLFANEAEIKALYEVDDFETALAKVRAETRVAAITRSEKGAVIVSGDEEVRVDADPVETMCRHDRRRRSVRRGFPGRVFARRGPVHTCGRLGVIAAAEVISHMGARPLVSLKELAAQQRRHAGLGFSPVLTL
jgi:sugar/nucleoside kinase (ribokinase family)